MEHDRGPSTPNLRHVLMPNSKKLIKTVKMGSCSPPSCKRTDPICCIDPRSGALFGQSMALDRLHKVWKAGAPGMGPYPKHKEAFWSRTGQRPHKRRRKGKHFNFENFTKNNGQVTQNNPPACHPKELQRKLPCFASVALLCWQPQSAYCAPE